MMSTASQHKKITDLYHQKYSLALTVGVETNLSQFVIFQFLHFLISSIELDLLLLIFIGFVISFSSLTYISTHDSKIMTGSRSCKVLNL